MSCSRVLVVSIAALLLILTAPPALTEERVTVVDATGEVDYLHGRSGIQVGTWARYRLTTTSPEGVTESFTSTLLIAGEEDFWGDDCFWVENQTELPAGGRKVAATLMSYAVFDDSLPAIRFSIYQRKRIMGPNTEGEPTQRIVIRGEEQLKSRTPFGTGLTWKVDTLGVDTVRTPRGDFACLVIRREQGVSQLAENSDSTRYRESRQSLTPYVTLDVPITHYARKAFESEVKQRTWLTGRSQEAGPLRLVERATGTIELLDFGTTGVPALLVPEPLRRPLSEQRAAKTPPSRSGARPAASHRTR
jgi:hypothetical protein